MNNSPMTICPQSKPAQPLVRCYQAILGTLAGLGLLLCTNALQSSGAQASQVDFADLDDIRFRREVRILVLNSTEHSPSADLTEFRDLLNKFNDEQFLIPKWVQVERRQDLVPMLMAGQGDLIAAQLSIEEYRARGAAYSTTISQLHEALIVRRNERISSFNDLNGRRLAIRERSGFWQQLHRLRERLPDLEVQIIPQKMPIDEVLNNVQNLHFDVALIDTKSLTDIDQQWPKVRILDDLKGTASLAYGLHPDAVELKSALDDFLSREQFAKQSLYQSRKDFPAIKERRVLRVLTHNNATDYFIWRGRPLGFEYRLLAKFAEAYDLSLKILIPESQDQFIPSLLAGKADIIAASMVIQPHLKARGIAFTQTYRQHQGVIVGNADEPDIKSLEDLKGRTLTAHPHSIDWEILSQAKDTGIDLKLFAPDRALDSEELIDRVASGLYDLTVVEQRKLTAVLTKRQDIRAIYTMPESAEIGWAVREGNTQLLAALNQYIESNTNGLFFNMLHNRYFEKPRPSRLLKAQRNNLLKGPQISPYDDLVRHEAAKYGFDWPLIVALMYRESRFDPDVESWAGAQGLMQVLPVTAERFGIDNLQDPKNSITAGIRMLDWLYRRLDDSLPVTERTWFALASYNAGLGHLLDARILAEELRLDPNRWFDNVEVAMKALSKPEYYRKAKHGYVRGIEPVTYVRDIRDLYNIYRSFPRE